MADALEKLFFLLGRECSLEPIVFLMIFFSMTKEKSLLA